MQMTSEQFGLERDYSASMSIAKSLFKEGLISREEYGKINSYFLKKYNPLCKWIGCLPELS